MLNREPMWLKCSGLDEEAAHRVVVSVLNREPMWLKCGEPFNAGHLPNQVSVLNREPMWLKYRARSIVVTPPPSFSAQP